jgi:hypothetical protein
LQRNATTQRNNATQQRNATQIGPKNGQIKPNRSPHCVDDLTKKTDFFLNYSHTAKAHITGFLFWCFVNFRCQLATTSAVTNPAQIQAIQDLGPTRGNAKSPPNCAILPT